MHDSDPDMPVYARWKGLADRIALQDWPTATLYVVATPIGNLGDFTLRAQHALRIVDIIAAEDTRSSRQLLDAWGVSTPLMAAHQHNEAQAAQKIIQRLQRGERVALISDAGAPGVSDPGARIVNEVRAAGYRVVPLPGPSAVIAALMAAGVTSDENPAFVFAGFAPSKAGTRRTWLQQWSALGMPVVMYESPHRLAATLDQLQSLCGDSRRITIARELTKRFEQVETLALGQVAQWLQADPHRAQGEFVLILHKQAPAPDAGVDASVLSLMDALLDNVSVRDAVKVAVRVTGLPRDQLYALALERSASGD